MSKLWQRFINGDQSLGEINPVIFRSWERCRESRIDFQRIINNDILPAPQLRDRVDAQSDLLQAGKDVLPFLVRYLKGKNYIVLLCDREGYILKSLGNTSFMSKAQSVHLSPGANWREDVKGTNAIGTVLAENKSVNVLGWEHYVQENHFLNCWAAPILNTRGEMVGVLDISGEIAGTDDRLVEIVLMGAKMIEQNIQVTELQNNFNFCREGVRMAAGMLHDGFVTINMHGEISEINDAGVQLLGRSREEVLGRPAADVFTTNKSVSVKGNVRDNQVEKQGLVLHSRFSQMRSENGNLLGAVGVLQPTAAKDETFWVGRSEVTRNMFKQAAKAAATLSTILIQGESGTGKEVLARYVHQMSARAKGAFVAINCAAIPATLIESELFGYVDGSFTGAKRGGQQGKFEMAENGTLFLDEIGDMPFNVQASLLRVLQEKEIYRVGDTKTRKVNARIVAASNKDLKKLVDEGKFRLDLYYRLKVVSLEIPPLRERAEDILDLAPYFVIKTSGSQNLRPLAITDAVYSILLSYGWPGNIRELENCIESMVAMADGSELTLDDLPVEIRHGHTPIKDEEESLLEHQTKNAIIQALSRTKGKVAPAARLLGIGRTTLYRKMEEWDIKV